MLRQRKTFSFVDLFKDGKAFNREFNLFDTLQRFSDHPLKTDLVLLERNLIID